MKFKRLLKEASALSEITQWLDQMGIEKYNITNDGTVSVDGNVNLSRKGLTELPVQFGIIGGDFDCGENKLTSLEGSPFSVDGDFLCHENKLSTLEGLPSEINQDLWCDGNPIQFSEDDIRLVCEIGGDVHVRLNNGTREEM